jgi:hypothetical protein
MLHKKLNDIQLNLFMFIIACSYILLISSFFGLSTQAPIYLKTIRYYVQIYICLFLIWRFNPLRNVKTFTLLDQKVAFSAGLFILTTTVLYEYINMIKNYMLHLHFY